MKTAVSEEVKQVQEALIVLSAGIREMCFYRCSLLTMFQGARCFKKMYLLLKYCNNCVITATHTVDDTDHIAPVQLYSVETGLKLDLLARAAHEPDANEDSCPLRDKASGERGSEMKRSIQQIVWKWHIHSPQLTFLLMSHALDTKSVDLLRLSNIWNLRPNDTHFSGSGSISFWAGHVIHKMPRKQEILALQDLNQLCYIITMTTEADTTMRVTDCAADSRDTRTNPHMVLGITSWISIKLLSWAPCVSHAAHNVALLELFT